MTTARRMRDQQGRPIETTQEQQDRVACHESVAVNRRNLNMFGWCPDCCADIVGGELHDRHCDVIVEVAAALKVSR
jgi:hypothetical protein